MIENSIEIIENSLQLSLLTICAVLAGIYAFRNRDMNAGILTMFFGSYVLGDIYWLLYRIYRGFTPYVFYVSDLSWYAAYLFLILILQRLAPEEERKTKHSALWLLPVFTAGMAVFYLQWGDIFGNVATAVLMGMLLYCAVRGLVFIRSHPEALPRRMFYISVIIFCAFEYLTWTASCFFWGDTLANPYYWLDFMVTLCAMLLLPAYRKAVEA